MPKQLHNIVNRDVLKAKLEESPENRITLSFYKYYNILNVKLFRDHLYLLLSRTDVFGRIYIANEGLNGQISVPESAFDNFKKDLAEVLFLANIRLNIAIEDDGKSFYKLIIKIRNKIVADGLEDSSFDVTNRGTHLSAEEFNKITDQENSVIIDMRNHYESEVGHFNGAICPDVETFRESLPIVKEILEPYKDQNIVMYCTGGIRCEKASAYFKHEGFENVYQLDGGIIEYARQAEKQGLENKFIGKNFVFDDRLGERISNDVISKCHQCGKPCDDHTNCTNDACHILFIQCEECADKYETCCSVKCKDFLKLPEEKQQFMKGTTQFNGTQFGKGRYKALTKDQELELN